MSWEERVTNLEVLAELELEGKTGAVQLTKSKEVITIKLLIHPSTHFPLVFRVTLSLHHRIVTCILLMGRTFCIQP